MLFSKLEMVSAVFVFLRFLSFDIDARSVSTDPETQEHTSEVKSYASNVTREKDTRRPSAHLDHHTKKVVEGVYEILAQTANHSWEWGTQSEVILERYYSSLSVYSNQTIPLDSKQIENYPKKLFDVITPILKQRTPGPGAIIEDGASGDPASLLVGVMVLGAAAKNDPQNLTKQYYDQIAEEQIRFLLKKVPRTIEGAISQRVSEIQLWSDFMFMALPSIAYYGASKLDKDLLEISYTQSKLYRQILQDPITKTWRHILRGSFNESSLWSTGNGWAAAGMMRVWATMNNVKDVRLRECTMMWRMDLVNWITEIIVGAFGFQSPTNHLLLNRYGDDSTYYEVSGTAMIVATAYRLIAAHPQSISQLPMKAIDLARTSILINNIDPRTRIVSPVVNPLDWNQKLALKRSNSSPEGQAFVVLMITAWEQLQKTGHYSGW